ncbi:MULTISPECIES: hypothetical protein [unclassified Gemella]|uniref:hypothetical protein n=1 Tax=unclassified Gemella TaxID=2624949 RepID=UPI0010743BAB|nr:MULTISPECIES: hypothetical protein [unclassified Gemella]MBF0710079.1 hypothetical protein [Gemella sp. GL1.1]MBF0746158.1 hypothetical protein [Gemella sp. 19428wG2_WT2a]NYS27423.1 hypothetical protein [Gemella sp. GL1]TFU60443.1 hypothetical protein E4T67_00465 [Gemella sp. WT2a]
MSEKQFWKIAYLYATKYNYDILHYRSEKKDIWFINSYNEITRLIFTQNLKLADVDSNVYNIINNEKRLKKVFKLSSLKIKTLHITDNSESNIQEYKKYKVSDTLSIERILVTKKNISNFIDKKDEKFINFAVYNNRYKNKVEDKYASKLSSGYAINFYFMILALIFILGFVANYLLLYLKNFKLYEYIDYNYQKIISGEFYRLFTDILVFSNSNQLSIVVITVVCMAVFLGNCISLKSTGIIIFFTTIIYNILRLFRQLDNVDVVSLSIFSLLGSMFIVEYNKRTNNLKLMYATIIPIVYTVATLLVVDTNINIIHYLVSFVLGALIQLILYKKINIIVFYLLIGLFIISGLMIQYLNIDVKSKINNYHYSLVKDNFENINEETSSIDLEKELLSENKSVVTYYQLGLVKMATVSISEAKKVFLEAINFDNTFAPNYYQLALIEYSEDNIEKSKEYINKAIEIDSANTVYKDLKNELG